MFLYLRYFAAGMSFVLFSDWKEHHFLHSNSSRVVGLCWRASTSIESHSPVFIGLPSQPHVVTKQIFPSTVKALAPTLC